jgi:hypothetical protein
MYLQRTDLSGMVTCYHTQPAQYQAGWIADYGSAYKSYTVGSCSSHPLYLPHLRFSVIRYHRELRREIISDIVLPGIMDITASTVNNLLTSALAPPEPPEFAFITVTNPQDIKSSKNQTKIRRYARRSTIGAKDQRRTRLRKIVFDLPESNSQSQSQSQLQSNSNMVLVPPTNIIRIDETLGFEWIRDDTVEDDERLSSSLSFLRPIGYGRSINPLAPLPTWANARIRHILNYGEDHTPVFAIKLTNLVLVLLSKKKAYRPLVDVWFTLSMSDESTFQITLANAAVIYGADAGDKQSETAESIKCYNMSLQSVNKRLLDPVDSVSEGVMGTVLGFACHDVSSHPNLQNEY